MPRLAAITRRRCVMNTDVLRSARCQGSIHSTVRGAPPTCVKASYRFGKFWRTAGVHHQIVRTGYPLIGSSSVMKSKPSATACAIRMRSNSLEDLRSWLRNASYHVRLAVAFAARFPRGRTAAEAAACSRATPAPRGLTRAAECVVRMPGCPLRRVRRPPPVMVDLGKRQLLAQLAWKPYPPSPPDAHMSKVFVAGSRKLFRLSPEVKTAFHNIRSGQDCD